MDIARATLTVLIVLSVATYFVAMILGVPLFYFTEDGAKFANECCPVKAVPVQLFIVVSFGIPVATTRGIVYGALWSIYALCFAAAWKSRGTFHRGVGQLISGSFSMKRANYLAAMPIVASALLVAVINIQAFQESVNVPTGRITFKTPYDELLNLTYAPIFEELSYRISPLGLIVAFRLLWILTRRGTFLTLTEKARLLGLSFLSPEAAKKRYLAKTVESEGVLHGVSIPEWAAVLVTSVLFGSAHFLSGGGWQLGKVSTAALSGLVLALVYLTHGGYAPILLHWFFNYYTTVFSMAAQTYSGSFVALASLVGILSEAFGEIVLVVAGLLLVRKVIHLAYR